jgi:hypothetical protein
MKIGSKSWMTHFFASAANPDSVNLFGAATLGDSLHNGSEEGFEILFDVIFDIGQDILEVD